MNVRQVKELIIVPALTALGLNSPSAVNLLLGTMAQESQMGHFIVQTNIGLKGGIGAYQMERPAYLDIWRNKVAISTSLKAKIRLLLGYEIMPSAERMASDVMLSTIMARLYYAAISSPFPNPDDISGLAHYYKKYWNTELGKATEQEFINNYNKYILVKS